MSIIIKHYVSHLFVHMRCCARWRQLHVLRRHRLADELLFFVPATIYLAQNSTHILVPKTPHSALKVPHSVPKTPHSVPKNNPHSVPKVAHLVLCIGTGWPMNYFAALGDAIYSRGVHLKTKKNQKDPART